MGNGAVAIDREQPFGSLIAAMTDWLAHEVPSVAPTLVGLHDTAPDKGGAIRLIGMSPENRSSTHLRCDMLVTVADSDPVVEGAMLAGILGAAMARPEITVLDEPCVPRLCTMLGIAPALGCMLRLAMPLPKPAERSAPRVRFPMIGRFGLLRSITGTVVGPGDVPVAGVSVSADDVRRSARTDRSGRFELPGVSVDEQTLTLTLRGRGTETVVEVTATDAPITVHMAMED